MPAVKRKRRPCPSCGGTLRAVSVAGSAVHSHCDSCGTDFVRGTRGPAPGTGGRPPLLEGERATSRTWRPTSTDRARIARLRLLWGYSSDTDVMRRALEMADDLMREG